MPLDVQVTTAPRETRFSRPSCRTRVLNLSAPKVCGISSGSISMDSRVGDVL